MCGSAGSSKRLDGLRQALNARRNIMYKHFILLFHLTLLSTLSSTCQDSLINKIVGKWGICYSLDTLDKACINPFNFYVFKADGTCQHGEVTIMDEKIPVKGYWRFENGSIKITYNKHPNFSYPPATLPNIIFLNNTLFYYKAISTVEAPGRWIFFSLKRID